MRGKGTGIWGLKYFKVPYFVGLGLGLANPRWRRILDARPFQHVQLSCLCTIAIQCLTSGLSMDDCNVYVYVYQVLSQGIISILLP